MAKEHLFKRFLLNRTYSVVTLVPIKHSDEFKTHPLDSDVVITSIRHTDLSKRPYFQGFSRLPPDTSRHYGIPYLQRVVDPIIDFLKKNELLLDTGKQDKFFRFINTDDKTIALPHCLGLTLARKMAKHVFSTMNNGDKGTFRVNHYDLFITGDFKNPEITVYKQILANTDLKKILNDWLNEPEFIEKIKNQYKDLSVSSHRFLDMSPTYSLENKYLGINFVLRSTISNADKSNDDEFYAKKFLAEVVDYLKNHKQETPQVSKIPPR